MDDDEDIQSHSPLLQVSPPSVHQNGCLTATAQPVTVAAAPSRHTLTLALPIQQPRTGGNAGSGGGREDCWSVGATSTLIDAWGERYLELSRGNLKQMHWKDVADIVSSRHDYTKPPKTDVQCKNRIDTLKKKYKLEKSKFVSGGGSSKWPFFHRIDHLIGSTAKIPASTATPMPALGSKVHLAIPVGVRSHHQFQQQQQQRKHQFHELGSRNSESFKSEADASPDSTDSFLPETFNRKRSRIERGSNRNQARPGTFRQEAGRGMGWGNSVKELTRAILKFGHAYERAESSKLQQVLEMQKQRMKLAKELELQRMKFFMRTQLELTQLKRGRRVGKGHHNFNKNNSSNSD